MVILVEGMMGTWRTMKYVFFYFLFLFFIQTDPISPIFDTRNVCKLVLGGGNRSILFVPAPQPVSGDCWITISIIPLEPRSSSHMSKLRLCLLFRSSSVLCVKVKNLFYVTWYGQVISNRMGVGPHSGGAMLWENTEDISMAWTRIRTLTNYFGESLGLRLSRCVSKRARIKHLLFLIITFLKDLNFCLPLIY